MQCQGVVGDAGRLGFVPIVEGAPTVTGRPVFAIWEGSLGPLLLRGSFERNSHGDTRMEMYMFDSGPTVTLWSARDQIRTFLDYRKKLVRPNRAAPQRPLTSGWTFSTFDATWSGEYQTILGQRTQKVILTEKDGQDAGYSWISENLTLVLREEVRIPGQTETWRITELELKEPAQDVLRIPPDFNDWKIT